MVELLETVLRDAADMLARVRWEHRESIQHPKSAVTDDAIGNVISRARAALVAHVTAHPGPLPQDPDPAVLRADLQLAQARQQDLASKLKDLADHAGVAVRIYKELGIERIPVTTFDSLADAVSAAREELERARKAGIFVAAPTSKEI